MMRVEICIRNAVELYGHFDDQVRPAQPIISTGEFVSCAGLSNRELMEGMLPMHPILKTLVHHVRFQHIWTVCKIMEIPKRTQ